MLLGIADGGLQGKGGHTYYGKCTNTNSIGIEMCDTIKDGKHYLSDKTRKNAIELGKQYIKKYGIKKENVIRHYDVTGKICPSYYVKDEEAWKKFKNDLFKEDDFKTYHVKVTAKKLNVREEPGLKYKVVKTLKQGEEWLIRGEDNGWGRIRIGWINLKYTKKI